MISLFESREGWGVIEDIEIRSFAGLVYQYWAIKEALEDADPAKVFRSWRYKKFPSHYRGERCYLSPDSKWHDYAMEISQANGWTEEDGTVVFHLNVLEEKPENAEIVVLDEENTKLIRERVWDNDLHFHLPEDEKLFSKMGWEFYGRTRPKEFRVLDLGDGTFLDCR